MKGNRDIPAFMEPRQRFYSTVSEHRYFSVDRWAVAYGILQLRNYVQISR